MSTFTDRNRNYWVARDTDQQVRRAAKARRQRAAANARAVAARDFDGYYRQHVKEAT